MQFLTLFCRRIFLKKISKPPKSALVKGFRGTKKNSKKKLQDIARDKKEFLMRIGRLIIFTLNTPFLWKNSN
jgi:hypothetical protein